MEPLAVLQPLTGCFRCLHHI